MQTIINIPNLHFQKVLESAEQLHLKISEQEEFLYSNEDNEAISDLKWDKMFNKTKKLKEERDMFYSMYSLVKLIDKNYPRNKNQQIDVTKIFISEDTYTEMKEHDRKLLKIVYKDIYSDQRIEKELGMIHLFSGFSISKDAENNKLYVSDNHLREKDF